VFVGVLVGVFVGTPVGVGVLVGVRVGVLVRVGCGRIWSPAPASLDIWLVTSLEASDAAAPEADDARARLASSTNNPTNTADR